jgi:hypothetical protein
VDIGIFSSFALARDGQPIAVVMAKDETGDVPVSVNSGPGDGRPAQENGRHSRGRLRPD